MYLWILIVGSIAAFYTAWGGGANDCANSFATSVGAKVISLKHALIIASIFEFLGTLLMGSHVTDTIRKGIIDETIFKDEPYILMYGMLCSCIVSGIWLTLATSLKLPVSTTHTTVGAICGFAIFAKGFDAINWYKIILIIVSWVASPLIAGTVTFGLFSFIRKFALKKENPVEKIFKILPFLVFLTMTMNSFFIIYKGTPALNLNNISLGISSLYSFSIGSGITLLFYFIGIPILKKYLHKFQIQTELNSPLQLNIKYDQDLSKEENTKLLKKYVNKLEKNIKQEKLERLYENSEKYDPKAEKLCSWLQIVTASLSAFAHGANDVANAIGPLAAIVSIYESGSVTEKSVVPFWVLAIGGVGIVVGLGTWGYKIINRMGKDLTKITPIRGFSIELGGTTTIIIASRLSIPVSTTHCQIGSTIGCALVNGKKSIDWKLIYKVILSWIVTLPIVAITSGLLFSFGYYSPKN